MSRPNERPVVEPGFHTGSATARHPAYGSLVLGKTHSSVGQQMFGSNLRHRTFITMTLHAASEDRHAHSASVFAGRVIAEWQMTESQFASMVSSVGMGSGTPVTLSAVPAEPYTLEAVPGIEEELLEEKVNKQIGKDVERYMRELIDAHAEIEAMLDAPTMSKRDLRERLKSQRHRLSNIGPNFAFSEEQLRKSVATSTASARHDIEAFINATVVKYGVEAIRGMTPQIAGPGDVPAIAAEGL